MQLTSTFLIVLFTSVTLLTLASCDSSDDFLNPEPVEIPDPRFVNSSDYLVTDSGLKLFDFTVGPGTRADSNLIVQIHYILWLAQDSTLITSSYFSGSPAVTQLGSENFVKGMEEGIIGMQVGGDRQIIIPPFLAFGSAGNALLGVPPNATLIVEVALLNVGIVQ